MLRRLWGPLKKMRRNRRNKSSDCGRTTPYHDLSSEHYSNEVTYKCKFEDYQLSKIGSREIVGHGMNSLPIYIDDFNFPFPAIRYKECTPELMAIREKERGDWRNLSCEEKKYLYRSSFRQTFSEFQSPNSEWKNILGSVLLFLSASLWLHIFINNHVYKKYPSSFSKEARIKQYYRQVATNNQPFSGNYRPPGADLRVHPKNKKMLDEINRLEGTDDSGC